MKIVVVGGGSGGHITPTIAVASEIKKQQSNTELEYILGRGDKLSDVVKEKDIFENVHHVFSGKFRRFHGGGLLQFLDIPTTLKNSRDMFLVLIGFVQSVLLLRKLKPDALFIKGGFVGVPVGLAAALLKIPFVTHDSDAVPGLANRIIGRWAAKHAVAMPVEHYSYPKGRTTQVGNPVSDKYTLVTAALQKSYKESFGLPSDAQVVFVTGGGLGAHRLNMSVAALAKQLLGRHPQAVILHISGRGKEDEVIQAYAKALNESELERVVLEPFVTDMYRYSGAADVSVVRAGANTLAELATQAKACIIVPNPQLTGGHQLKNAELLKERGAVTIVDDEAVSKNPELLLQQIEALLDSPQKRLELARNLHSTSFEDSAQQLAQIVLSVAEGQRQ